MNPETMMHPLAVERNRWRERCAELLEQVVTLTQHLADNDLAFDFSSEVVIKQQADIDALTESRDACQRENSRLALAKQEMSVFLDEAIKDRDYYDELRKAAEQQAAMLTNALTDYFEVKDRYTERWSQNVNSFGARFVVGQLETAEQRLRAAIAVVHEKPLSSREVKQ